MSGPVEERRRKEDAAIARLEAWSEGHEKLCTERQERILSNIANVDDQVSGLVRYMVGVAGMSFLTLLGIVAFFVAPYFK